MHVVKFPWLKHAEGPRSFEIYSVAVSPDSSMLATGGLDGKVKIWSIDTLNKYKNNNLETIDNNECRPLCSMTRHAGAITCVRFSPNSKFLASGSDDKLILIWEKDEEKTRIMKMHRNGFGGELGVGNGLGGEVDADLEHWTVRKRLVAHDNDVQDMAWAPDSSILVTVGLDRSIVVWNGTTFEKIKRFDIHQSHVKGVVFDPAGKYFATCSDDRSMRIFRYRKGVNVDGTDMDFVVENIIRDPFAKSPLTTYFRRCSWSPDGLYIAAPNGTNEGVNANVVIKRGSWESELSLIGHRLPCEVCSFSPRLYDVNKNDSTTRSETVIITAGQDKTLTLWSSSCATPLCVVTEISAKSITDVAWNPNGLNVYLCGLDGVVLSLFFDESELGHVVPWEENNRALIRYGKDRDLFFPESVEQLKLEEFAEKRGIINNLTKSQYVQNDRIKSLMAGVNGTTNTDLNSVNDASRQVMNVLVPRSKKHPNRKMPVPTLETTTRTSSPNKVNILTSKNQKVTITKSGKKRVAPMLISSTSATPTTATIPSFSSVSSSSSTMRNLNLEKKSKLNSIMALPYPPLPKHGLATLTSSLRTNLINDDSLLEGSENAIDYIVETDNNKEMPSNKRSKLSANGKYKNTNSTISNAGVGVGGYYSHGRKNGTFHSSHKKSGYPEWIKGSIVTPTTIYGDKNNSSNVLINKKELDNDDTEQVVEIRYENENTYKYLDHNDGSELDNNWTEFDMISHLVAKYTNYSKDHPKCSKFDNWSLYVNDKITCVEESNLEGLQYWCISTENGRLLILSETGRQLCGSIELGSNIVKIICDGAYIMCVCSSGLLYSWEFKKFNNVMISGKAIIDGTSLAPIVNTHLTTTVNDMNRKKIDIITKIKNIYMRSNGCPIIVVNHEKTDFVYTFDPTLESWIEILNTWYIKKLTNFQLEKELVKLSYEDNILKLMINRFMKHEENTENNKTDNKDESILHSIFENWKSSAECVAECINRKLEKC